MHGGRVVLGVDVESIAAKESYFRQGNFLHKHDKKKQEEGIKTPHAYTYAQMHTYMHTCTTFARTRTCTPTSTHGARR